MKLRLHNAQRTMMLLVANGISNQASKYKRARKPHKNTRVIPLRILAKHGSDKIFEINEGEG